MCSKNFPLRGGDGEKYNLPVNPESVPPRWSRWGRAQPPVRHPCWRGGWSVRGWSGRLLVHASHDGRACARGVQAVSNAVFPGHRVEPASSPVPQPASARARDV